MLFEARFVDTKISFPREVGSKILGKSVGVIQLENGFPWNDAALRQPINGRLQNSHTLRKRLREPLLLLQQNALDVLALCDQLGIGGPHLRLQGADELVEERLLHAQLVPVANSATNDAPQYVAPALSTWNNAVGNQKRARSNVIGNHSQ